MESVLFSKLKKIIFYSLSVYTLIGFFIFPILLKPQIINIVQENTNAKVTLESLYFNPFIFQLTLSDVRLYSLDKKLLVTFKSFLINFDPSSLLYGALHIKKITLSKPTTYLTYNRDKTFNLLNIIKKNREEKSEENSSSPMPRIIVDSVAVIDGGLFYKDYTKENIFEFSFEKIGFLLYDIDTAEVNASSAGLRLYSTLGDGGFIDFKTKVVGFAPFEVKGSLDFEASKLYTEWKYIKDDLNLEVADGKISFHTDYRLNFDELNATTIDNLNISLDKLRIKPKNRYKDVLTLENFYVKHGTIKPFIQSVDVEKIGLIGLNVKVKRQKSGEIDWSEYIKVDSSKTVNVNVDENLSEPTISEPWNVLIRDVAFEKISLAFKDEAIKPKVISDLNELNLYAQDITLLGETPFSYQINMLINKRTKCKSSGTIRHKELDISSLSSCKDFDIVHYRPYLDEVAKEKLNVYDVKLQSSLLSFQSDSRLQEIDESMVFKINDANISLDKFRVNKRSTKEKLVTFKSFNVNGIKLNTQIKELSLVKTSINSLNINAIRYKNGKLNLENLVVPKPSKEPKKVETEKDFSVKLEEFSLKTAKVNFTDKVLTHTTKSKIDEIYLNLYNIDLKKNSWLSYSMSMRVNEKGTLKAKGKLRHTPLKQKGSFEIKDISLTELTPYIQETHFIDVNDGRFSLKGTSSYGVSKSAPDLRVKSSFKLDSFFVNDTRDDSLLLSLNEVDTKEFTLELFPNRLYINEIDVNAFYINTKIDENKSMNFSQLSKFPQEINSSKDEETPFDINILKTNIALGSAKFTDYSIPIKFSTHIHHLDGVIYSISNTPGETTYLNIAGEVDNYGSTRLKGSIDSSNPKAYTDLAFNFKNLELNSLSGYIASFAGHEIESGKLYLDLGYDILNSELHGSNTIMMKKVVLGPEIDDENITVLPLGFIIGLLEDGDGVIDIDMPVEGNLDEPDFKYGTLILKTIGNLIAKAVLSPFKFLGSVMGIDAEELEYVGFEAGRSIITPPEREKLDQIVKMMSKKPKILLALNGVYDEKIDAQAIKLDKLIDIVMIKSGIKNRKEHESAMNSELLEDIYEEIKDDDVVEKLRDKLSKDYKDDEYDRNYFNALLKLCIDAQTLSTQELLVLADARSKAISFYLVQEKFIDQKRVIVGTSIKNENSKDGVVKLHMQIEVK